MTGLGRMMTGGPGQKKRRANDFYATPPDVTRALLRVEGGIICSYLEWGRAVWEPACGDGAISREIEAAGLRVISTDLHDYGYGTPQVDFLGTACSRARGSVIITNPPFKLAAEFITHAHLIGTQYLALLLKSTYWHAAGRYNLWRAHTPAAIYPLTWRPDFIGAGRPTMEVMWCIWRHHCPPTIYQPLPRPTDEPLWLRRV